MTIPLEYQPTRRLTVRHLIAMVYRRKLIVLGFFLCALGGGYLGLKIVSPVYRSTAQVMVNLGQEDVFMPVLPSSSSEVRTPLAGLQLEQRANSEVRIIQSPPLTAQIVAKFGPAGLFPGIDIRHPWYTPRGMMQQAIELYREIGYYFYPQSAAETLTDRATDRLQRSIKTDLVKDSTVIEVSMDNAVPEIAASSLNDLLHLYLQQRTALYQRENDDFFDRQLAKQMADLQVVNRQLEVFRTQNKVLDVDSQREALLHRLAEVDASIQNEAVAVTGVQKRIGALQRQMQDNITLAPAIRADLLRNEAELPPHQDALANWTRIKADLTAQIDALNKVQSQSSQLMQQQRVLQDNRKLYLQKVEETRIQKAMRSAQFGDVVVVNWAVPNYAPVSPKLAMVLGGVVAVGLLGGIGLALLLGLMDDRITHPEDVVEATGLPVIGRVGVQRLPRAG